MTRLLKRLFRDYPGRLTLTISLTVVAGLIEGVGISLFLPLLQLVQKGSGGAGQGRMEKLVAQFFSLLGLPFTLSAMLIFIMLVFSVQYSVSLLQQHTVFRLAYRFQYDLREKLFRAYMAARWQFFLSNKIGNLANGLVTEPIRTNDAFQALNLVLSLGIICSVYAALALALSWQMTLIIMVVGGLVSLSLRKRLNRGHEIGQAITSANSELQMETIESLSGAKLIKSQSLESGALNRFRKILEVVADKAFLATINLAWVRAIYEFSIICLLTLIVYLSVEQFGMTLAKLTVLLFIFFRLAPRVSNVQNNYHQFLVNMPGIDEIDKLHDAAVAMREGQGHIEFKELGAGIDIENVDFSYQDDKKVLKNINIKIAKSKIAAIVGRSGSGKSTLIDLIVGLMEPTAGKVVVDGVSLDEYDFRSWRRKLGYVSQETFLFHDTIYNNIASAGAFGVSEGDVKRAATLANAHDFIMGLPEGYETVTGDRGVRLSGGQRQRIALARALVHSPDVLILDEATSALDSESEQEIQEAIQGLAGEITIIIVTHRLSTVQNADIIYVLDEGRLIESGSWNTLLSNESGSFQKMQKLQLI